MVFRAYGLVSRAGTNVVYTQAKTHNGAISRGQLYPFDHSKSDGRYQANFSNTITALSGERPKSMADYVLTNDARQFDLRSFSKSCYDISSGDECTNWTSSPAAVGYDGQEYKVSASITGKHYCDSVVQIRHPV